MRRGLVLTCLFGLAGCAADPSVRYMEATDPAAVVSAAPQLIDSFYLQQNMVHIELHTVAAPGKPAGADLIVTDSRAEDLTHRLMILRDDNLWTRTTINLSKVENSDLIDSAGVAVEDHRMELIQTIGSAAKLLASIAPAAGPSVEKIKSFSGCDDFPRTACDLAQPSAAGILKAAETRYSPSGLTVRWGPVAASAVAVSDFTAHLNARHVHGLYYAACRSLEVRFSYLDMSAAGLPLVDFRWIGKIADPRWVEYVRFPRKGGIRMHSQCGVSVTSEADPTQSTAALLGAALNQAVAVKQAVDAQH